MKVFIVTVKDGNHLVGRATIAASSAAKAERMGQAWAVKYLGGWPDHYKATAKPKLLGGAQLQVLAGERAADAS